MYVKLKHSAALTSTFCQNYNVELTYKEVVVCCFQCYTKFDVMLIWYQSRADELQLAVTFIHVEKITYFRQLMYLQVSSASDLYIILQLC